MEVLRVLLGQSIATSLIIGLILSTSIPLAMVPLTRFLKRRKRSINSYSNRQLDKPDDYIFVVTQTIVTSGTATGVWLHIAANNNNILWSLVDATPATIIKTFIGCFFLREFFGYWSHRFFHSKLLYKRVSSRERYVLESLQVGVHHYSSILHIICTQSLLCILSVSLSLSMCKQFHAAHHAIIHAHDDYDGYYIDFFETLNAAFLAYLPTFIVPKVHVIAVIIYQVLSAFFIFSMNHCGRDVKIAFDWSFGYTKPLILYDTQNHNDHHLLRRGNYSELLPILDKMFGTAIEVEIRQPLPAQKRWKKLARSYRGRTHEEERQF